MNYYFLASYLPEIMIDDRKIMVGFGDILGEQAHISPSDWREIQLILLGRDVFMVERLLDGRPSEAPFSVHPLEFWADQIKSPRDGPPFILEFIEARNPDRFGPQDAARLWLAYYTYVQQVSRNDFLKSYFQFEMTLKNVLAAIRARRLGLSPGDHLIGESDVNQALIRSNAEDFGLGSDFPWIEKLIAASDPAGIQAVVESIFWDYLAAQVESESPFDFNVILSYLLRLDLLEKRLGLDQEQGAALVGELEGS